MTKDKIVPKKAQYKKKQNGKNDTGRPSKYSQKIADDMCEQLAIGKSLRTVCKADDMPSVATVFAWMREHSDFLDQYTRAKTESADALIEEIMDIADDSSNDWMENNDPNNPGYKFNGDHYQRARMRVDVRKWVASKMKPKKYGEKIAIGGDEALGPIEVKILKIGKKD